MVGLGDTAKKIQTLADRAEEMYKRLNELREQVAETQQRVGDTHDRVLALEGDVAQQRALVEAVARESGVDVDAVLTDAAIGEAEAGEQSEGGEQSEDSVDAVDTAAVNDADASAVDSNIDDADAGGDGR